MYGMLKHPAAGEMTDAEKISHIVTKQELRSDGTVYGEADILDTPMGRIAETLFKAGCKLGISSRGDGTVEKKGGADEVQDDFRLETYDLVLKPSTPGAYPGIVENVEEHERLVAEAIEGLVNSELPEDQRMPVLTESLKILSVLEGRNSGDKVKALSEKITEELGAKAPETLVVVTANESSDKLENTSSQEEPMTVNQDGTGNPQGMDANLLKWHQEQMTALEARLIAEKDSDIQTLKDNLLSVQQEHRELTTRLHAAEELIEKFQQQVKDLEEGVEESDEYITLQTRYDAAVELLDEALVRLPEIKQHRHRAEALEGLLQASIDRVLEGRRDELVKSHFATIPEAAHEQVNKLLEGCETDEDVEKVFESVKGLIPGTIAPPAPIKEPLPGQPLSEGATTTSQPKPTSWASTVGARLNKAV